MILIILSISLIISITYIIFSSLKIRKLEKKIKNNATEKKIIIRANNNNYTKYNYEYFLSLYNEQLSQNLYEIFNGFQERSFTVFSSLDNLLNYKEYCEDIKEDDVNFLIDDVNLNIKSIVDFYLLAIDETRTMLLDDYNNFIHKLKNNNE